MDTLIFFMIFFLGTIIGSFLNVVINRYGTESLLGRSHCPSCGKTLSVFELIPIASFFFLKGRCHKCQASISFQYPLVELLSGVFFLLIYMTYGPTISFLFYSLLWSILLVIAVYDFKHTIIPDFFVFLFVFLVLVNVGWGVFAEGINSYALYFFAGPLFFLPFFLLWFVSKGAWMGLGDGKLALGIGFFLGMRDGFDAIILSFWIGAAVSLLLMLLQHTNALSFGGKRLTMKSEVPFGPFLVLGTGIVYFFDLNIISFLLF